jgi:hypothetical protein
VRISFVDRFDCCATLRCKQSRRVQIKGLLVNLALGHSHACFFDVSDSVDKVVHYRSLCPHPMGRG